MFRAPRNIKCTVTVQTFPMAKLNRRKMDYRYTLTRTVTLLKLRRHSPKDNTKYPDKWPLYFVIFYKDVTAEGHTQP